MPPTAADCIPLVSVPLSDNNSPQRFNSDHLMSTAGVYRQKVVKTGGRCEESTSSTTAGNFVLFFFQRGKVAARCCWCWSHILDAKLKTIISGYSRHFYVITCHLFCLQMWIWGRNSCRAVKGAIHQTENVVNDKNVRQRSVCRGLRPPQCCHLCLLKHPNLKRNVGCESTLITRGASLENNYRAKMTIYILIG